MVQNWIGCRSVLWGIASVLCCGVYAQGPLGQGKGTEAITQRAEASLNVRFPIGVFEDGNLMQSRGRFQAMVEDLGRRGLSAVMAVNCRAEVHEPLLGVTDPLDFSVFLNPAGDLNRTWWPAAVPAAMERALEAAEPFVKAWAAHPSLKGYYLTDEPPLERKEKLVLLSRAVRELDPSRPNFAVLIGLDRVAPILDAAQFGRLVIDVYPCGYNNAVGDFTLTGFGYKDVDFVGYVRQVSKRKPADVPLWIILQTHRFGTGGRFSLRQPLVPEVRAQHWLSIGEGATGIFWFVYSSQQGWLGLKDNPELYEEITALTRRTNPLRAVFLALRKAPDRFAIGGGGPWPHYVSTMVHREKGNLYLVAVNRDCESDQDLVIDTDQLKGELRDVESGVNVPLGKAIRFRRGDGRIFEFLPGD